MKNREFEREPESTHSSSARDRQRKEFAFPEIPAKFYSKNIVGESITAFSLDVHPQVFSVHNRVRLSGGGVEEKHLVSVTPASEEGRSSFVERLSDKQYLTNWKRMKEAGLPVVPELLINPMRNALFLPDLKEDGSELYGKGLAFCLANREFVPRGRPRPEIDALFFELTKHEGMNDIAAAADALAEQAKAKDIGLPSDDFAELLMHPDGSWELVILDLSLAKTDPSRLPMEHNIRAAENLLAKGAFLRSLGAIRSELSSPCTPTTVFDSPDWI